MKITDPVPAPNTRTVPFGYVANGDLTTVTDVKGGVSTYAYSNHQMTSLTDANYHLAVQNFYDSNGRVAEQHNALDRLTQATYPGNATTSYTYDPVGDRTTLTVNGTPISYSYDNADELTQVGSTAYGYDANGNQTSRGGDTFTYDPENRLTQSVIGGQTSSSVYNGDGLRVSHTVGGTTTNYVWDAAVGLPEVLQDGTNTYVYGLGLISATDGSGNQTYFLHDGLGSTVALTDGSGNVTATYEYDAFGAVRSQTGSATNPWQFTGQQLDADSSLYFLRARYYDPTTGRFLGRDPLSASVNPYSYADNNPVNATDPSGMVATTRSDADLGYPVISDVGGTAASKEGGQMPSYADCQNQINPLWLFCPSALIRLANGAIIDLPPWERSLLDGLAAFDSGGDAAYATGGQDAGQVNNPVPRRLARVIPAELLGVAETLGAPQTKEVFVTAAEDVRGITNATDLAERLTLVDHAGELRRGPFAVIEFDTPVSGLSSPVGRSNPGFAGRGLTAGGAREFSIPNFRLDELKNVAIRIVR